MKFNVGEKVICIKSSYNDERNLPKYEKFIVAYSGTIGVFVVGRLYHYSPERFVTEQQYRKLKLKKLNKIKYE
jgi:hypothetical protein